MSAREIHKQIGDVVGSLRAEDWLPSEPQAPAIPHRRLAKVIGVLSVLIGLQILILVGAGYIEGTSTPPPAPRTECDKIVAESIEAVISYEGERGRFPSTLAELVPNYLPGLPRHPQTNTPIAYAPLGEGFRVDCANPK